MAPLAALPQAWVSAEASLPLGWQILGVRRFGQEWVSVAEGPTFDDYVPRFVPTSGRRSLLLAAQLMRLIQHLRDTDGAMQPWG